jgi:hypothetical protein
VRRHLVLLPVSTLLVFTALLAGCGEGGAASGATVSVYVAAPLCREVRSELTGTGEKAGDLRVRAVCLPEIARGGHNDLAIAGRNARRATEDSTAVAYLEVPGSAAKFTESMVESANIAWLEASSGSAAMRRVLRTLEDRGSESPRAAVSKQVG